MQTLNADRVSVVTGSFYSNDKKELSSQVTKLLKDAQESPKQNVNAIIVPHAGYVFSAPTAAIAYKTLHKKYKNVFVIGSSHHVSLNGASIYNIGKYQTPLGKIKMNESIIASLMKNPLFAYEKNAHSKEHTLEVQLPFLQTIYGDALSIVPIIIGTTKLENIIELSKVLKPYFDDEENLFVISTDLSHYPSYENANIVDRRTLESILKNSPDEFVNAMLTNEKSLTPTLDTSACGWSSVLTLLYMTKDENYKYELLAYINSGDTHYGDKDRVVGYGALQVYKVESEFFLTQEDKNQLLEIAKLALYEAVLNNKRVTIDQKSIPTKFKREMGAFVTLNKNHNLRGCIGRFEPNQALYSVVIDMTIAAAFNDNRFQKVTPEELKEIELEISVLTPRKKIESLDEIVIGKHGIYIQKGSKNGTLLPHVATEMKWNKEEFLNYCATQKAGIRKNEIKDAELFSYEAIVFTKE